MADMASGSGPQTPSVTRGFAPTVNRRLWGRGGTATTGASVHGGSFGATTVSSFPVGSAAGGGRGGSPASWSSPSTGQAESVSEHLGSSRLDRHKPVCLSLGACSVVDLNSVCSLCRIWCAVVASPGSWWCAWSLASFKRDPQSAH